MSLVKEKVICSHPSHLKSKMARPITQIIEKVNKSTPPPCPSHGMWGGRMTRCVSVPTKKLYSIGSWRSTSEVMSAD